MTAALLVLQYEAIRAVKEYCLEPTSVSEAIRARAVAAYVRASEKPMAFCYECPTVGALCGLHKICRRAA